MASATADHGYLPSRKVSLPIGSYQIMLLGDRGTCVNNLPRVALDSGAAGIRTRDLLVASPTPYCYATKPHRKVVNIDNYVATHSAT